MPVLSVQHVTTYQYRRAVGFGEHRMMFRPRDSFDQRVVAWDVAISPEPSMLRSLPDTFGNIVTVAHFTHRARELRVENRLVIDHTPTRPEGSQFAPYARQWPFTYDLDDCLDLGRVMQRHYHDPEHKVDAWARGFLPAAGISTFDLLRAMTLEIRHSFTYCPRYEEGVQVAGRPPGRARGHLPRLCGADDRGGTGPRNGRPLRDRLHLFAGKREQDPSRQRRHPCLGRGVHSGSRLD